MNSADAPDIIITYHAPNHVKFGLGNFTKGSVDNANIGNISVILDSWNNGIGQWGLKADYPEILGSNFTQIIDSETTVSAMANSYIKFKNGNIFSDSINYRITKLIIPEGITDLWNTFINISHRDTELEEIILPNTLKRMYGTFIGNQPHNITSYTIPASVEYVEKLSDVFIVESSLKEIIMEPLNPPTSRYENPFGDIAVSNIPDVKIKVYADCIDKYKNDAVWGQYSKLYDVIKNTIVYYEDDNRYIDYAEVIINIFRYRDYKKLYITSEIKSISGIEYASYDDIFIQNSIYDSRNNCHAVIKTETNELIKGSNKTVIPNSVTKIVIGAFYQNILDTINIPDNVTLVEDLAFRECEINNLIVGKNCKFNNVYIDNTCVIVDSIVIANDNPNYDNYDCNALVKNNIMYRGCKNTTIPEHITDLNYTFINAHYLESYQIPNNITNLYNTFADCNNLKTIDLGNVRIIGANTFENCISLKNIIIPDTTNSLHEYVFYGCELENIHIGSGLNYINDSSFSYSIIHNITISNDNQHFRIENNNLIHNYDNKLIKSFNDNNIISSSIEKIRHHAYYGMNINSINIPDNIKSIDKTAFDNTPLYKNNYKNGMLIIDDWLVKINLFYFNNESIVIPSNIHNIGCCEESYPVKKITCEGNITNISDYAFTSRDIGQIYFISDNNLKYIGTSAFQDSDIGFFNLVPGNETYISDTAFYSCRKLKIVTLYDKITYLGEHAFAYCENLTQVELLNGKNYCTINEIKNGTFMGCSSLPSITIPSNINKIGDYVFDDCISLVDIYYKGTKDMWWGITKGKYWNRNVPATVVHCTDGDINI